MTKQDWNIFEDQPPPADPENRGWLRHELLDSTDVHIMPAQDGVAHAFSKDCACKPEVTVTREDVFIVHNPADGRSKFRKDQLDGGH